KCPMPTTAASVGVRPKSSSTRSASTNGPVVLAPERTRPLRICCTAAGSRTTPPGPRAGPGGGPGWPGAGPGPEAGGGDPFDGGGAGWPGVVVVVGPPEGGPGGAVVVVVPIGGRPGEVVEVVVVSSGGSVGMVWAWAWRAPATAATPVRAVTGAAVRRRLVMVI